MKVGIGKKKKENVTQKIVLQDENQGNQQNVSVNDTLRESAVGKGFSPSRKATHVSDRS